MDRAPLPKISLFCTKGGSDKEYHAQIKEVEGGYIVELRNGKRGAAKIQPGTPVVMSLVDANKKFEKIVKEKMSPAGGYTKDESGIGYATSELSGQMSGNNPHLLVPISTERMYELAEDDRYGFEEKIDGERLLSDRKGSEVMTSNKLGVINTVPVSIVGDILALDVNDVLFDGESKDKKKHVFDILRLNGRCLKHLGTKARHDILSTLLDSNKTPNLVKVELVTGTEAKRALVASVIAKMGEGIVAKLLSAPYVEGKAAPSMATQFKWVLVENASFVVTGRHPTKRSVSISILGPKQVFDVGFVTIPANAAMPDKDDIIDVRYRHLFLGGCLCQPVFVKPRSDVRQSDCILSQITRFKVKTSETDIEEEDE
jgi:hypothetical protein